MLLSTLPIPMLPGLSAILIQSGIDFFTVARSVELKNKEENTVLGKRKRTNNEAIRMRNLAVVASL